MDGRSPEVAGASAGGPRGTVLLAEHVAAGAAYRGLAETIRSFGWECSVAEDIEHLAWLAALRNFSAVVLRGASPGWVFEALAAARGATACPVVVVTGHGEGFHAQVLDAGASLVVETGAPDRLLRSAIRAAARRGPATPELRYLDAGRLRVDVWSWTTTVDEHPVELTPTEFRVLRLLMSRAQAVVPHHELIKSVWNWKYAGERNALRLQINRLRHKLAAAEDAPDYIRSVRGIGYTFTAKVAQFASSGNSPRPGYDADMLALREELRKVTGLLSGAAEWREASRLLVDAVVADRLCDGAAVFARRPGDRLMLVAQAGMPPAWQTAVSGGLPLAGPYIASRTVSAGKALHYADITKAATAVGASVRLLRPANLSSQLSLPLFGGDFVWGQAGFGRRGDSPFAAGDSMVLETAASMLGSLYALGSASP